jgi:hypothetical protein
MWFFDVLKPSHNFARSIKLIFNRLKIPISKNTDIWWYDLLVLHDTMWQLLNWEFNSPIDIRIVKLIYNFLKRVYNAEEVLKLHGDIQRNFLIDKFEKEKITILDITYYVLEFSAIEMWVRPDKQFNNNDILIINKVYWF